MCVFFETILKLIGNRKAFTLSWSTADTNLTWNLTSDRYSKKNEIILNSKQVNTINPLE